MSKETGFKVLSERDHILMRPGMYIGSTSPESISQMIDFKYRELTVVPGLLKIINEIIDNSIDEAIRTDFKFANKIDVAIEQDVDDEWYVSVKDNGRGIPIVEYNGIYQAEIAWTKARAGTSFSDDRNTIGANGVGSFATNCFSKYFEGNSGDGTTVVHVSCKNNCDETKIVTKIKKQKYKGTHVQFWPDLEKFHLTEITQDHIDYIKDRLFNIQICYPEIQFTFNSEKIKTGNLSDIAKQFSNNSLPFSISNNIKLIIGPSGDEQEFRFISYLNGLNLINGGTHIDYIMNSICSELRPMIKKKWKIDVMPNQIKQHLILGVWVNGFVNPKFDSQSKERLTNTQSEISSFFNDIDYQKIVKKIISTDEIINPMIEAILYKKEQAEKRAAKNALKNSKKIKSDKHIEASSKNPQEKILVIAEGLSAISGHLAARNPYRDGAYALRGKVVNINGLKKEEIAHNIEYAELMGILGLNLYDSSVNEDPDELFEITIDDTKYIAAKNDIVVHNNKEYKVSEFL